MVSHLRSLKTERLFGLYTYVIPLNIEQRITAIIGPNGRGKTVCLRLIEALFSRNYGYFASVPFGSLTFDFTGGEQVIITAEPKSISEPSRDLNSLEASEAENDGEDEVVSDSPTAAAINVQTISIVLLAPNGKTIHWTPTFLSSLSFISHRFPFLEQTGPNQWVDQRDGEELTTEDVLSRYQTRLPPHLRRRKTSPEPEDLKRLLTSVHCQLIETQRLLVLHSSPRSADFMDAFEHRVRRRPASRLAIRQKADKLREIFRATLTEYATLSQSLDRTFPRRVLEGPGTELTQQQLRTALEAIDRRRSDLMTAGILDREWEPVSISGRHIEPSVARVLEIYVSDTNSKLAVFDSLSARISTFKELIEKRFLDKTLQIDRENGFKIISTTGREVPLDKLSSGEQHQLILIFDLLFEVRENSLILIDEPELSLHVAWQKTFVDSLRKMISLNGFDVIVATHSPPLVARHFDLTVELGAVDE